jgi:hypothetical protein
MSFILQNAIYIPSKDLYLISLHRHHFNIDLDTGCACDGGKDYLKRTGDRALWTDWSVMSDTPDLTKHHRLLWGTRGKDGKEPISFRPISSLELDHLKAILANCSVSPLTEETIKYWIKVRERFENVTLVNQLKSKGVA